MNWNTLSALMAMGAPPPSGTQSNPKAEMFKLVGMMLVMGFVMYFIMIRPQRQQQKKMAELLKNLKPGDKVLAGGGIIGIILTVKERTVTLRTADTKLEILKSAVSEVLEKSADSTAESKTA